MQPERCVGSCSAPYGTITPTKAPLRKPTALSFKWTLDISNKVLNLKISWDFAQKNQWAAPSHVDKVHTKPLDSSKKKPSKCSSCDTPPMVTLEEKKNCLWHKKKFAVLYVYQNLLMISSNNIKHRNIQVFFLHKITGRQFHSSWQQNREGQVHLFFIT